MRSFTPFLTFVVLALILHVCTAAPHTSPTQVISSDADNVTNTIFPNTTDISDNSTTNGTAVIKTGNHCYHWGTSEKWIDVGGQHSDFVKQSVYDLCQMIAVEAYKGFPAGSWNIKKRCKEVRKGTQGRNYDRSIAITLTYTGPMNQFDKITAGYCNDLMAQPLACGAGGEFDVQVNNPNLPKPWVSDRWEAKADPNRNDCKTNKYNSDL